MPLTITWLQEHRVIFERITGVITAEDLASVKSKFQPFFETGIAPIHIVIDMLDLEKYPLNVRQIKDTMANIYDTRVGWVLLVTGDHVVRFLSSITTQLLMPNARLRTFDNLDAALRFLSDQDSSLSPLSHPAERLSSR